MTTKHGMSITELYLIGQSEYETMLMCMEAPVYNIQKQITITIKVIIFMNKVPIHILIQIVIKYN